MVKPVKKRKKRKGRTPAQRLLGLKKMLAEASLRLEQALPSDRSRWIQRVFELKAQVQVEEFHKRSGFNQVRPRQLDGCFEFGKRR